jgi:hypothetical protein
MRRLSDPPDPPFKCGEVVRVSTTMPYSQDNLIHAGQKGMVLSSQVKHGYTWVKVRLYPRHARELSSNELGKMLDGMDSGLMMVKKYGEPEFICWSLERVSLLDQLAEIG